MVVFFLRIAFFEVQDWERPFLQTRSDKDEIRMFKEPLDEKNADAISDFDIVSVFIYSNVNKAVLEKLSKLRLVATRSTGFDHIDLKECSQRGITVCNVPVYGEITVAEHTFALILSLSRLIHDSYERTRRGDFSCEGVEGFDLHGKILGVLGTGRIGVKVIEIAKGFKMDVLAFDKVPDQALAEVLGFRYVPAEELLEKADVISLHLPLNDQTFHFLNKESIGKMKKGVVIINTARGGLIDTHALVEALMDGKVKGAGLDVLEEESLIREEAQLFLDNVPRDQLATMLRAHILLRLSNVIITPHCAFSSVESMQRLTRTTLENIEAFIAGKPQNIVKPKM
ncbi:MAG: hydroxyacid dehydrogenase [Candidatus Bathyarchaeia archaeon]|jgi:D-lactate dehydrogenase